MLEIEWANYFFWPPPLLFSTFTPAATNSPPFDILPPPRTPAKPHPCPPLERPPSPPTPSPSPACPRSSVNAPAEFDSFAPHSQTRPRAPRAGGPYAWRACRQRRSVFGQRRAWRGKAGTDGMRGIGKKGKGRPKGHLDRRRSRWLRAR